MKERKFELTFKNISFYIVGFLIIGLGVNLMLRSEIGAGAWDATNFNLNYLIESLFTKVTFGTTSLIIGMVLFTCVILYKQELKMLIMLVPVFTIFLFIDFWDLLILNNFHPTDLTIRLFLFAVGLIILPFGLASIIHSNFPATVYDEFSIMMHEIFKFKSFSTTRLIFELLGVALAAIFGLFAGVGLGAVNIGTLIMAVTLGPILNAFLKMLRSFEKDGVT